MTKTFWLSFCDTERPTGQQFLGVSIVTVDDADAAAIRPQVAARSPHAEPGAEWLAAALRKAWETGCNPGGEVAGHEIPSERLPHLETTPRHELLSRRQLIDLGHELV